VINGSPVTLLCPGDFDGSSLGSMCGPDSGLDLDWSCDSGPRCAIFVLAIVLRSRFQLSDSLGVPFQKHAAIARIHQKPGA
jgi:hypothetical protein